MTFKEFVSVKDAIGTISSHLALISSYRHDRPQRLNVIRHKELANDIGKVSGFQFVPISGTSEETKNGKKIIVAEKSYLIMAGATTHDSFIEYIVHWLNKYEQEYAIVRFSNDDMAWKILPTGNKYMLGDWEKVIQPKISHQSSIF